MGDSYEAGLKSLRSLKNQVLGSILRFQVWWTYCRAEKGYQYESVGAEEIEPTVSMMIDIMGANDQVLVPVC